MKYYVLGIWGDVEPNLYGPFDSELERDAKALQLKHSDELDEGGIYRLNIDSSGGPTVDSYTGIELNPEEDGNTSDT